MSYPQFNLTTLQLPAPASNMTKAEYKTAYGIDLDAVNIKAFKLVLLGEEKYPIDQIKEIEDGYEIYFNGRVLSITDIIQTSDEIYDVVNSKPIYIHPVMIFNSDADIKFALTCLVFNNSATPLTLDTFKTWFNNLYAETGVTIRVMMSGGYGDVLAASFLGYNGTNYFITGKGADLSIKTAQSSALDFFDNENTIFTDGVNKIN